MMIEIVIVYLSLSVLLYCILGGADFGAGIIEGLARRGERAKQEHVITHALGPVWEANHIWLILAVVILFNAFPPAFTRIMTTFHLPVTLMLVGIVLRGCAFTFRHYDAVKDDSQRVYSSLFVLSSFLTPFFQGVIAGGLLLGGGGEVGTFYEAFVAPWANLFCFSVGFFFCSLVVLMAAVFLIGESDDRSLRRTFTYRAAVANLCAVVGGAAVFVSASFSGLPLVTIFLNETGSLVCMVVATVTLVPLWFAIKGESVLVMRILAGVIMTLVLGGWFAIQYPYVILGPQPVSLYESAAPAATLRYLVIALMGATVFVLPFLLLLLRTFKSVER